MFGASIDYARVRIIRGRWWPFQSNGIVMAPTGNIHFHPADPRWSADYAAESLSLQGLFIHEMTHVWQSHKHGRFYLPLMRHPFCRYDYQLKQGRPFDVYGLEQQAEIVRHRFLADRGATVPQLCDHGLLPFERIVT
ncbi:MAG: vgr related protein [Sphingomonas bacterium]|nr:vgr related protein [Sphingomonas bacterium]